MTATRKTAKTKQQQGRRRSAARARGEEVLLRGTKSRRKKKEKKLASSATYDATLFGSWDQGFDISFSLLLNSTAHLRQTWRADGNDVPVFKRGDEKARVRSLSAKESGAPSYGVRFLTSKTRTSGVGFFFLSERQAQPFLLDHSPVLLSTQAASTKQRERTP